ncbi:hypothetical protein RO3G_14735 [Rhizopus delemar RA 99-880]|uniref:Uncharacterized protein n=1 Tax=Rhizopus delemar (strain RA 99-880 / ATCC MYA-4621 / FGSC 9543 / NRRL 43880) TaxID=246409 RepID=I1CNJ4_RHIO9|nr:hypothetical protein RO3G_14735 [Rhizopus delemar RA 99-880]|eukprot:EIE90024.1 hypothetical protein RO3G_14735 [Rhizopus delemar RA 99-880]
MSPILTLSLTVDRGQRHAKKAIGSVPDRENGLGYESFENVFQASILLYPFLRVISGVVAAEVNECKADFKDGEAQLESMTQQLKASGLYKDNKSQYKADGLIKMDGIKKLEIVLLETSYRFGSKGRCKAGFDHHKGFFGSLSMMKTIADCFSLGTMESFKKVKVFLFTLLKLLFTSGVLDLNQLPAYMNSG